MAYVCKQGNNTISSRKVPIIFLPGVMGSRLTFPTVGESWDPDSNWAMLHWVRISAETMRQEVGFRANGTVMTTNSSLSATELAHGWAGVVTAFYVPFLRFLVGLTNLCATCPVYAVGYDWRQSNKDSGNALDTQITTILNNEKADNFILISHSMGGLVSRACLKNNAGNAGKLSGVIHVVQPAAGAAVFYRRMYTGAISSIDGGWGLANIQGTSGRDFATIMSGLRGPCELVPTNNYRDTGGADWLWDDRVSPSSAWNGNMFTWYSDPSGPPNLWWSVAGVTTKVTPTPEVDLKARISESDTFHSWLGTWKHPNTWAIFSTGVTTDMGAHFNSSTTNRGIQLQRRAEGDGTVPGPSGGALFTTAETSTDVTGNIFISNPSMKQCQVSGVEHAAAFNNSDVQTVIQKMLLVILGCVSGPGDFPDQPGSNQTADNSGDGDGDSSGDQASDTGQQQASNDSSTPPDPSDWSTDDSQQGTS